MLPFWMRTEENVRELFTFLGFNTLKCSIQGRQIDLIATLKGKFQFQDENWIIEVTTERVDSAKGSADYQKLNLANTEKFSGTAKMMLVTTSGFTDDQKASLEKLKVVALTLPELESTIAGLSKYAMNSLKRLANSESKDIGYDGKVYIPVNFRIMDSRKSATSIMASSTWIGETLNPAIAGTCALLGNLGSGKTSALQKLWQEGSQTYLEGNPGLSLPIFIPLGKYKQHSGDILQMIMSEFRLAGIVDFPSGLIEHYIRTGRVVLLLDGLDEIHPISSTDDILDTISTILFSLKGQGKAVISCRRHLFESNQEEQGYFGSYTYLENSQQLQTEIRKLFAGMPSTYIAYIEPFSPDNIYDYLKMKCGLERAECDAIFTRFYGFREMCSTPVLLAMIATTISDKTLDIAKNSEWPLLDLYDAYVSRWIKRDKDRSKLSEELRKEFSKKIAVRFARDPITSCDWAKVRSILTEDPEWGKTLISDDEAQREIRTGGFLVREDDGKYRFVHRSIMEYLCACADLDSYRRGQKPMSAVSDGHRMFLERLAAKSLREGEEIWPANCWYQERGEEVLRFQSDLVLGALAHMKAERTLRGMPNLLVHRAMKFSEVVFEGVTLKVMCGGVEFERCDLRNCSVRADVAVKLHDCQLAACRLSVGNWSALPAVAVEGRVHNSLKFPEECFVAATLHDLGCVVEIGGTRWELSVEELTDFNEIVGSIKGKAQVANVSRGRDKSWLSAVFRKLKGADLVEIDESRVSHQITLTAKMRQVIEGFKQDPIKNHHRIKEIIGHFK